MTDNLIIIYCFIYYDIIVFILNEFLTFLFFCNYKILCHYDKSIDVTDLFCVSILFDDNLFIQWVCYTLYGFDEYIINE